MLEIISIKIDGYERDTIKRIAELEGITVSAVVRRFIHEGLRRHRRKKPPSKSGDVFNPRDVSILGGDPSL